MAIKENNLKGEYMSMKLKKLKLKIPCIFLLMALVTTLFAGCSSGSSVQLNDKHSEQNITSEDTTDIKTKTVKTDSSNTENGRFIENEVSLPQEISKVLAMTTLEDGSFEAIGSDTQEKSYYVLKSDNRGESWNKKKIEGLSEKYYRTTCISVAPNGMTAFVGYPKKNKLTVELLNTDGNISSVQTSLPESSSSDNFIVQIIYNKQDSLFALDMDGSLLKINTSDGKLSQPFDTKGISISYMCVVKNTLIAVHSDGIMLFDIEKEEELATEGTLNDIIKKDNTLSFNDTDAGLPMYFTAGAEDGKLMFVNESGIFSYTMGGSITEQLIDAALTSLNDGGVFTGMTVLDKDNIFLIWNNDGNGKILHYVYDKDAKPAPDTELKVYALDESSILRRAVTLFQKKYPDISVKLEIGMTGDDSVTLEDALSTLNTNILAKKDQMC